MDFNLTDEQQHFVAAIRDFCDRECGTQQKREQLTNGYTELHNRDIYSKMADLGWLGVTIPEEYCGSGGTVLDAETSVSRLVNRITDEINKVDVPSAPDVNAPTPPT